MNKTVLVIEDEKALRENIVTLLEEEGYKTLSACGGQDGIKIAAASLPDIIICDIMMRETDGYDVLRALSERKETSTIPFIFLTAKVERGDIRLGMELGADDYLLKPFKKDELLGAIKARLKKKNMMEEGTAGGDMPGIESEKQIYDITDRLFIKQKDKFEYIKVRDIKYITADNQYTVIHIDEKRYYMMHKSMKKWAEMLPGKNFLRIHRSVIINTDHLNKIEKWYNNSLRVYLNNISIPFTISKRIAAKIKIER